ncbi:hypothetical protein GCK72_023848 [Caenorhabditis remanei]|uniref:Uncharacterized protein n=1 Tax=Caenorhabditis remanei TaxID=31234 RepID=A0A6A5FXQ1_CAERE|nr:hypothetical protein GCK72_023848 [Caenorhabditis remanei]KAF1747386.1 hypothetical protein GCK72_023848 [Caenorhabditis remanei]
MESLFIKIVCIGCLITCLTVYYEEVLEFVKFQAYGNPYWLNVSQLEECICDGGKTRNCYPHPDDSGLCGKCFATCPEVKTEFPENIGKRSDELVFGLSASMNDVNRLLVLIASIHRNFPTTKLIIFDHANGTALESQLISIRNVEVVNFKNRVDGKAANTPFYLQEILAHYSNVLWLTHDVEILNTKLMQAGPFRRSSKFDVTYISHDKRRKVTSSGYRPYFPTSSLMPHFPMAILLKNEARNLIRWVEKCALTPECWKCDTSSGMIEDCTWMVLHQVAIDAEQFRFLGDTNGSINKQTWGPPECDFYCTLWLVSITIVAVVSFGVLALVLLKNSTKKTK